MTDRRHERPTALGRRLVLVGWTLGLAATLAVLVPLGRDHPGSPPLTRPADWGPWFAARQPVDAAAAVGRILAIVLIGYLLMVTVIQVLLALRPSPGRPGVVDRAGPRFLAMLTATLVTSAGPAMAGESGVADPITPTVRPGLGATMELVEPAPSPDTTRGETSLPWASEDSAPTPLPTPVPEHPALHPEPTGEWVVRPGDHLWGIAAEVVERSTHAEPDERAIRDYWVRLIDANRDRLVDPENPDLILAGQRLRLP